LDEDGNPLGVNDPVELPEDAMQDRTYPRYSIKNLVIW